MPKNNFAIGVDLGGTKLGVGLVDIFGKVHEYLKLPTDVAGGVNAVQQQILFAIKKITQSSNIPLIGVGIGIPGQIEKKTGIVHFAPNLNWHKVPLTQNLREILHLPVVLTNDVRAATWGEWLYGAGKGCKDLICMFVGTGIGGGIVSNGHVLEGCSNTAGEIGHLPIEINGELCTCGSYGCLEAYAGGWAIAKRAQEAIQKSANEGQYLMELAQGQIDQVTAKLVFQASKAQDALAQKIIEKFVHALIIGCTGLVNAFNPCRLILGGGVMEGALGLCPIIEKGVKQYALSAATRSLKILPSQLHAEAGVIGGAALAFHSFIKKETL